MSIEIDGVEPAKPANTDATTGTGNTQDPPHRPEAPVIQLAQFTKRARVRIDVPRLNISDDVERLTFMAALIGGGAVIWLGEYFDLVNTNVALFVATVSIFVYAMLCFFGREQRIRLDRAGDNCYYLGLTYTLLSLSVALVKREVGTSPDALIQTFGIAVGSTIVGVIARLLLIQYRTEVDDVEERARVELAAAADELKHQLVDAASRFQSFAVSLQDVVRTSVVKVTDEQINRQKKLVEEINAAITKVSDDQIVRQKDLVEKFHTAIAQVTDDQIARQKDLIEKINGVLTLSIEAITQSTTVIESSLKQHSKVMEKYEKAAEKSATAAEVFAAKIESLAVPDDLISNGFTALQESLANAVSQLGGATLAITTCSGELSGAAVNLSQLAAQSGHVSSAMATALNALTGLKSALEGMTDTLSTEAKKLGTGNKAVEDEVARMKTLTLDYAQGLSDVAQFLAKEIGRART